MEPQVGAILEGKVTAITKFGAFVALAGGGSGLIHISEIANSYVNDVHDFLQEGQSVRVAVLPGENGKINLSLKKAAPAPNPAQRPARPTSRSAPRPAYPSAAAAAVPDREQSFEDKLKSFLSSSEGKMADLNRANDNRRSRRRK